MISCLEMGQCHLTGMFFLKSGTMHVSGNFSYKENHHPYVINTTKFSFINPNC